MRKILLRQAALMSALAVGTSTAVSFFFGPATLMGVGLGGAIAALDYLGILWLITGIVDPQTTQGAKVTLGIAFGAKLVGVASLLYWTVQNGASGLGLGFGITLATFGFVLGLVRAQQQIDQGS